MSNVTRIIQNVPNSPDLLLKFHNLETNINSFHLLQYRMVDGFLISAKNSGTHWLRFMISAALAHHFNLPPPRYSTGPEADAFIGHPKRAARYDGPPRLGSSHNLPSSVIAWLGAKRFLALPPTVVLVRDIREALASFYLKWSTQGWRAELNEPFSAYLRRRPGGRGSPADVWWFVRFFNRWGEMAKAFGRQVMVVRYEDVQASPGLWVRRIGAHWGVNFTDADIAAALAVSGRETMRVQMDPTNPEPVIPLQSKRDTVRLTPEDERYLASLFRTYLKHDFGYGCGRPAQGAAARPGYAAGKAELA
jgi:hypothetical protein